MKIKDDKFFSVIRSFLNIYLLKNRGCSLNTVESYEDTLNHSRPLGESKRKARMYTEEGA